jgi:hypothetical protein
MNKHSLIENNLLGDLAGGLLAMLLVILIV